MFPRSSRSMDPGHLEFKLRCKYLQCSMWKCHFRFPGGGLTQRFSCTVVASFPFAFSLFFHWQCLNRYFLSGVHRSRFGVLGIFYKAWRTASCFLLALSARWDSSWRRMDKVNVAVAICNLCSSLPRTQCVHNVSITCPYSSIWFFAKYSKHMSIRSIMSIMSIMSPIIT